MDETAVEGYITQLKNNVPDDSKVALVLLRWLELKKKYEKPEVEAPIELDMEVLRKRGEETVESDEPAA